MLTDLRTYLYLVNLDLLTDPTISPVGERLLREGGAPTYSLTYFTLTNLPTYSPTTYSLTNLPTYKLTNLPVGELLLREGGKAGVLHDAHLVR